MIVTKQSFVTLIHCNVRFVWPIRPAFCTLVIERLEYPLSALSCTLYCIVTVN